MVACTEMLAFGSFDPNEESSLAEAAEASAVKLFTTASNQEAARWLDAHEVGAILLGDGANQAGLALETRAQSKHRQLPILALARQPSDLDFAGAYSWGADDVVSPREAWPLTTRLRALARAKKGEEPAPRGTAVIAELDQSRRVATARALFNAGYDVRFAVTREDAQTFSLEQQVSLVVVCTELCEDPIALIRQATEAGSIAKFIVSTEPRRHSELSIALARTPLARVTDASDPPENVVFLANELSSGMGLSNNKRASPRILHGTTVRFRGAGREEDELGFSYNVSEGGIYVRTLAPPSDDIIWIELTPPKSSLRVRLTGQIAWRRPFGPHGTATVPPGFGAKIIDMTQLDRAHWVEGCGRAAAELLSASLLPPEDSEEAPDTIAGTYATVSLLPESEVADKPNSP